MSRHTQQQKWKRDERFNQNLQLASEGDEIAIHILWIEYQFDYEREGGRHEFD